MLHFSSCSKIVLSGGIRWEERTLNYIVCGVVWYGVVWCGVVWCGVVWCGVVWCVLPLYLDGAVCVVGTVQTWPQRRVSRATS